MTGGRLRRRILGSLQKFQFRVQAIPETAATREVGRSSAIRRLGQSANVVPLFAQLSHGGRRVRLELRRVGRGAGKCADHHVFREYWQPTRQKTTGSSK